MCDGGSICRIHSAQLLTQHITVFLQEKAKIQAGDRAVPVQVIFCLKEKNQKKSNSHRFMCCELTYLKILIFAIPRWVFNALALFWSPMFASFSMWVRCLGPIPFTTCGRRSILTQMLAEHAERLLLSRGSFGATY
jgi:hypothetical protein